MSDYNYATFDMKEAEPSFRGFANHLHAGERAPDVALEDLASGASVPMRELWRDGPAVIEFGSFT